jgi:hypothetical protein
MLTIMILSFVAVLLVAGLVGVSQYVFNVLGVVPVEE